MRGEDRPERKALRRLRGIEAVARHRLSTRCRRRRRASAYRRPARPAGPPGARRSPAITRSISAASTNGRAASWISTFRGSWPRSAARPSRTESCRVAPPCTTITLAAVRADSSFEQIAVIGVDGHDDRPDRRMRQEGVERARDDRAAADAAVLLGPSRLAGAFAAAGRDDHHGDLCRRLLRLDRRSLSMAEVYSAVLGNASPNPKWPQFPSTCRLRLRHDMARE